MAKVRTIRDWMDEVEKNAKEIQDLTIENRDLSKLLQQTKLYLVQSRKEIQKAIDNIAAYQVRGKVS